LTKYFGKPSLDDEKKAKGKPYFCEKASLKSVRGPSQHVQQNAPRDEENQAAEAAAAERQTRLNALSYFLRPRTQGVEIALM
jgi:hypothetical protein